MGRMGLYRVVVSLIKLIALRINSVAVHLFYRPFYSTPSDCLTGSILAASCRLLQCKGPHFLAHWGSSGNGWKKQGLAATAPGTCFHAYSSGARIRATQGSAHRENHFFTNKSPL